MFHCQWTHNQVFPLYEHLDTRGHTDRQTQLANDNTGIGLKFLVNTNKMVCHSILIVCEKHFTWNGFLGISAFRFFDSLTKEKATASCSAGLGHQEATVGWVCRIVDRWLCSSMTHTTRTTTSTDEHYATGRVQGQDTWRVVFIKTVSMRCRNLTQFATRIRGCHSSMHEWGCRLHKADWCIYQWVSERKT